MPSKLTRAIWSTKAAVRDGARWGLWHSGVARLAGRSRRIVFVYHTVGEPSPVVGASNMLSAAAFERHLAAGD